MKAGGQDVLINMGKKWARIHTHNSEHKCKYECRERERKKKRERKVNTSAKE
jgi:hypothetical protein